MELNEAILQAQMKQLAIRRTSWKERKIGIIPTNSAYLGMFCTSENGKRGKRNWNPRADDLTADDWELF